jgi:hypothetical protein
LTNRKEYAIIYVPNEREENKMTTKDFTHEQYMRFFFTMKAGGKYRCDCDECPLDYEKCDEFRRRSGKEVECEAELLRYVLTGEKPF